MNLSLRDGSAILPLIEALPGGTREKLKSLFDYVENTILFPLRMVENPPKADEEFEELYPEYERIRVTINTLLLDSLGENSYEKIQRGVQGELEDLPTGDFLTPGKQKRMVDSHKEAGEISNLIVDAAANTQELTIEEDSLQGLPKSRQDDFSEFTKLIGKWELSLAVASSMVVSGQGKREIVNHYIDKSQEFIKEARERLGKLVQKCTYCDKPFLIRRTNQKYCSESCLNKARNQRYREGEKG